MAPDNNEKSKTVTWLHLSDLHLCNPKSGWEADTILNALKEDLEKLKTEQKLQPDLIFVTGDIAFGQLGEGDGKSLKEQYDEAGYFLLEICDIFSIPFNNLYIVPGNHDINRSVVNPVMHSGFDAKMKKIGEYSAIEDALNKLLKEKGTDWKDFIKRLDEYKAFLEDMGLTHLLKEPDYLYFSETRKINGIPVGIAGFNSAWSCYPEAEKGKLWLAGHWQIENLFKSIEDADVKIALMHHPLGWFTKVEEFKIKKDLQYQFDILLHGHEHSEWVERLDTGYTQIAAGACYGDTESEMGYNITRVDTKEHTAQVWLRCYQRTGKSWIAKLVPKHAETGIWELKNFGKEDITPPPPEPPEPSPEPEPLSPPPLPQDTPEYRGVFGREKDIAKIADALEESPLVTVYGLRGIGKSKVIDEVRRVPSLAGLKYHRYRIDSHWDFNVLFEQLAEVLGCHDEYPKLDVKQSRRGFDFSALKQYVPDSRPAVIHLERAHLWFDRDDFKTSLMHAFIQALPDHYPDIRVILESQRRGEEMFPDEIYQTIQVYGIDEESMTGFFLRPFPGNPKVGWELDEDGQKLVFEWLGGKSKKRRAHPLAMNLLAAVAVDRGSPVLVLRDYEKQKELKSNLDKRLFQDLYETILDEPQRHMLRLCALYQEDIPHGHLKLLCSYVEDKNAFEMLRQRCLVNSGEKDYWYELHSLIREFTMKRMDNESQEYYTDNGQIADAWLDELEGAAGRNKRNINATVQAFFHLTEAGNYLKIMELKDKYWNSHAIRQLGELSALLAKSNKYKENRGVLELLTHLSPEEPRYYRFLGETIQKLEGKGNEKALECFKIAYDMIPDFPPYLANLGVCLSALGRAGEYVGIVEGLPSDTVKRVMNDFNFNLYFHCLDQVGRGDEASQHRRNRIREGARDSVLFSDEARYLMDKGQYDEAMRVLETAEKHGCANDYTLSIKASLLQRLGREQEASGMRRQRIEAGARHAAFFNDEAKFLMDKGEYDQALKWLDLAEERGCSDEVTWKFKAAVLRRKQEKK